MSGRCPHAVWKPLAGPVARARLPRIRPDIICVHTIVGSMASTWDGWRRDGYTGVESTLLVGGMWGADLRADIDGVAWQAMDADRQADANFMGSRRVISIETGDNAPARPADIKRWTPKQAAKLVDVIAWCCEEYRIPAVLIPDTKPGRRGLAYHRQGCEHSDGIGSHPGFLMPGGERWSTSLGKECPGPVRIRQFIDEIIPAVRARLEGDDMPLNADDKAWLKATIAEEVKAVWTSDTLTPPDREADPENKKWQPQSFLRHTLNGVDELRARPAGPAATVNVPALAAELAPHLSGELAAAVLSEVAARVSLARPL
jgi:hypothetical protein